MKRFLLILVVCSTLRTLAAAQETGEFWISSHPHWKHPAGAPLEEKVAHVTILYLDPDYLFAKDECTAVRMATSISISDADRHTQWVGKWGPIADGTTVTYRLVARTVKKKGERLPGRIERKDIGALRIDKKWEMGNQLFERITPTNAPEYVELYRRLAGADHSGLAK